MPGSGHYCEAIVSFISHNAVGEGQLWEFIPISQMKMLRLRKCKCPALQGPGEKSQVCK